MPAQSVSEAQRAAVRVGHGESAKFEIQNIPVPDLQPGEILVKINYSGVCASDKSLIYDEWSGSSFKFVIQTRAKEIAGYEGAGVVAAAGEGVNEWKVGDRAGIKWIATVCGRSDCEMCSNGRD